MSYLWSEVYSKDRLKELVVDQYTKVYMAYREVAETSLTPFLKSLSHYSKMPIRIRIGLQIPKSKDPSGREPVLWPDWEPVPSWDDFSVKVELIDRFPRRNTSARAEEVREMLRRMGRRCDVIRLGGWMTLNPPYTSSRSSHNTAVIGEVAAMVKEDIQDLFRDLAGLGNW
jgi:hypothetical protein